MRLNLFIVTFLFTFLIYSCKKEQPIEPTQKDEVEKEEPKDENPPDGEDIITDTIVPSGNPKFLTLEELNLALDSVYAVLGYSCISGADYSYKIILGDLAGTEIWYPHSNMKELEFNEDFTENYWEQLYKGVYRANFTIYMATNQAESSINEESINLIIAQARFLRGMFYFWLSTTYKGTYVTNAKSIYGLEFSGNPLTFQEISNVLIEDFLFSYEHLPKQWLYSYDKKRASWGAATAMLGKVYLYNEQWGLAAGYFKQIIDETGLYSLEPSYQNNFSESAEFGTESIFEVEFSRNYNFHYGNDNQLTYSSNLGRMFANIFCGGWNVLLPSYYLHELFLNDSVNTELVGGNMKTSLRCYNTLLLQSDNSNYFGFTPTDRSSFFSYGQSAYIKKHSNWYLSSSEPLDGSGINFRHIRLADIYLMYAEAILENNDNASINEALKYIDLVRARAGALTLEHYMVENNNQIPILHLSTLDGNERTFTNVNTQSLLTHIKRVERPLELCYEGHRWNDLRRWGIIEEVFQELRETEIWLEKNFDAANAPFTKLGIRERIRNDLETPSSFYSPELHDYLPIPQY